MKKTLMIIVISLFTVVAVAPSPTAVNIKVDIPCMVFSNGDTLYVGGSGPNNYTKIQDAIDNASDGDEVFVYDDSSPYYETLLVDNSIEIMGENKYSTIVDGGGSGDVFYITANEVTVTGFTIQYCGGTWSRSGIRIISNDNTISSNIIINVRNGIFIQSSFNTISGNIIKNNAYRGIRLEYAEDNTIKENIIINNERDGIYLWGSTDNIIYNNIIVKNEPHNIFMGGFSENNIVYHNTFRNSLMGNAYDDLSNIWDDGYPSGGNYWDDYTGYDDDGDGIGDIPYDILGGDNHDQYPLMTPWGDDEEPPYLEIFSPEENYLYVRGYKILPFFTTIIIGKIDILVHALDKDSEIDRVEFYIDDILETTDYYEPFTWTWEARSFGKLTIQSIAYDNMGNTASVLMNVWKFM